MAFTNLNSFVANHMKVNLPREFFYVPDGAKSIFSTRNGTRPKRQLVDPPSPPVLRSDLDSDIRQKAKSLREEFPQVVREISAPLKHWVELYKYFDGVELWTQGASFLFFVINHISNENAVLDHELESSKNAEIAKWAKMWVAANEKRILETSPIHDLVSIFDASEKESIKKLTPPQEAVLKQELKVNRELLQKAVSEYSARVLASMHSNHQIPQPAQPTQAQRFHPIQHHGIQQGQSMIGQPYPIGIDQMDPQRAQMMSLRHMPGPVQSYNHFMENQRHLAVTLPLPVGPVDYRHEGNAPWERRAREYSNEMARNVRGGSKGNSQHTNAHHNNAQHVNTQYNNFGNQNRSNIPFTDRRMVSNNTTPRGSPHRRSSQLGQVVEGPIYVHTSQRGSPPFDDESTPKASNRGMIQSDQHIFSDPLTGRTGLSNDARLWNSSEGRGATTRSQNLPKDSASFDMHQQNLRGAYTGPQKLVKDSVTVETHQQALRGTNTNTRPENLSKESIPFDGHPQAVFKWAKNPSCTFFYTGEGRTQGSDFQSGRTLYVGGVERDDFESHKLKDIMSEFGQVESVSYLFANGNGGGPAFVAFTHESALEPAIRELNGFQMPSGRALIVNLPNPRSRSGSQSSQRGSENQHFGFGGSRDFQPRPYNRHNSIKNQSISYRPSDRSTSIGGYAEPSLNSSESQNPSHTPLTADLQAQSVRGPVSMHHSLEPINASFSEVLQKRAALDQMVPQLSLANLENHANTHKRQNGYQNNRNVSSFLSNGDNQVGVGLSEPELKTKKENSPPKKKKLSNKSTPLTSPKKDITTPQTGGSNQKSNTARSKKKGNKQNSSTRPTPAATPIASSPTKSSFEYALAGALEKEQIRKGRYSKTTQEAEHTGGGSAVETKLHSSYGAGQIVSSPRVEEKSCIPQETDQDTSEPLMEARLNTLEEVHQFAISDAVLLETVGQQGKSSTTETKSQIEKSPGVVAVASSKSESDDGASVAQKEPKSKNRKNKKKTRKSTSNSDGGNSSSSMVPSASNDSFDTPGSSTTTESMESSFYESSSRKPSIASGLSEICLSPVSPLRPTLDCDTKLSATTKDIALDAIDSSRTSCHASASSTPKPLNKSGSRQRHSHAKKDSNNSTTSNFSVRKADMNSSKGDDKCDEIAGNVSVDKVSRENQKENEPLSPVRNALDDPNHWPALGPSKNPRSNVAAGKPSAVSVPRMLTERVKTPNAPIVAIPLNMQRRRPSIDSRDWPYVKKCTSK